MHPRQIAVKGRNELKKQKTRMFFAKNDFDRLENINTFIPAITSRLKENRCMVSSFVRPNFPLLHVISPVLKLLFGVLSILLLGCPNARGGENLYFNNLSIRDGLSHKKVSCIAQDHDGFMWFGTDDGLNRYDGCSFKVFKHNPEDTTSLSASTINCLCVTRSGDMWVGCDQGVCLYNPEAGNFIRFRADNDTKGMLGNLRIKTIFEDHSGIIWIGTFEGLIKLDPQKRYINYYSFVSSISDKMANEVRDICQEDEQTLWLGTFDGLYRFNIEDNSFVRYEARHIIEPDTYNNLIDALYMPDPKSGILYVGSSSGLTVMNTHTGKMTHYRSELSGLTNNDIHGLILYDTNTLLIGTANGLSAFDLRSKTFTNYNTSLLHETSLPNQTVWCVAEDWMGGVWFGTDDGVASVSRNRKKIDFFRATTYQDGFTHNLLVYGIAVTPNGEHWLATKDGVFRYDREMRLIRHYQSGSGGLSHDIVKSIMQDSRGIIWAGTNDGLNYYDARRDRFVKAEYFSEGSSLKYIYNIKEAPDGTIVANVSSGVCFVTPHVDRTGAVLDLDFKIALFGGMIASENNDIGCVCPDRAGNVWLGSNNKGIIRYERQKNRFTHYFVRSGDPRSIVSNRIYTLFPDGRGSVWVGTDSGLCRLDIATGQATRFNQDPELAGTIPTILSDDGEKLWLTNTNKLIVFDYKEQVAKIICDLQQSFGLDALIENSICRDSTGLIHLGGNGGVVYFRPSDITFESIQAPLVFSSFELHEREIDQTTEIDGKHLLQKDINETSRLKLAYNQNTFKIHFALLNYGLPRSNRYKYRLAGHDTDWILTDGEANYAEYANLNPGKYVFTVYGSNPDGVWSRKGKSLDIWITPPWWKSWWARTLYVLFFLLTAGLILNFLRMRIRLSAELKLEKLERMKMEELNQIRMRVFTNISHEFKTPLSLIMGPLEELSADAKDEKQQRQFALMKSNSERLLRLIDQIMDMRKYDNRVMPIELRRGEFISFTHQIFLYFQEHARSRNIEYWFENNAGDNIYMFFDSDKVEKMIFNVISNAFKFTTSGGSISVVVSLRKKEGRTYAEAAITDTGQGIRPEDIDHIFDRFYQGANASFEHVAGTGIGLCLTRDYAEQHEGSITVASRYGEGSTFTIQIPCDLQGPHADNKAEIPDAGESESFDPEATDPGNDHEVVILVVDDNDDILEFMRLSLEASYKMMFAHNGNEALDLMKQTLPDIIITDVMMPVMDGLEFCRKVKADMMTCHIPVILLTAKKSEKDREDGYANGADGFITKPFSINTLKTRIRTILQQRVKLRERYRYMLLTSSNDVEIESEDDKFVVEMLSLIEKNLDNSEFGIQELCDQSKYSYQQIYRKIKALTGKTINEFIRSVRLNHAARYLRQNGVRVSEIMYKVGFNSHSYFTKCFKEVHGMSPREYAEKYRESKEGES